VPPPLATLLADSKALSPAQREAALAALRMAEAEGWVAIGVGAASVREIFRMNILQAALLAMRRAVLRLKFLPDLVLVDGKHPPALACPVRCIIGGDALEPAISAASIVAKVVRDRAMARLAARCPGYGWEINAGYGTAAHRAALHRLGITAHHREGFGTVRALKSSYFEKTGGSGAKLLDATTEAMD
jgi:ribonuclease HII